MVVSAKHIHLHFYADKRLHRSVMQLTNQPRTFGLSTRFVF